MAYEYKAIAGKLISKAKIGDTVYLIKDKEARSNIDGLLEALKTGAYTDLAAKIAKEDNGLATGAQVATAIEEAAKKYTQALIFRGVSTTDPSTGTATVGDGVVEKAAGNVVIYGTKEFVADGSKWIELGDEGLYVTKAEIEALKKNARVTFTPSITVEKGDMGKADTYNVTIAQDVKPVAVPTAYNALDVTTSGTVVETEASAPVVKLPTGVTLKPYKPAGNVQIIVPSLDTSAGDKVDVKVLDQAGTGYSLSRGSCSRGDDQTSAFNTDAYKANIGSGLVSDESTEDSETLVLSPAATGNAVTSSGAINYSDPVLSGALPTFKTQSVVTSETTYTINNTKKEAAALEGTAVAPEFNAFTGEKDGAVTGLELQFKPTTKTVTPTVATSTEVTSAAGAKVTVAAASTFNVTANEQTADVIFTEKDKV